MRKILPSILFITFLLCSISTACARTVDVDVMVSESFYPIVLDKKIKSGLVYDFINILNEAQNEFHFIVRAVPPLRFMRDVEMKQFDLLFLSSKHWSPPSSHHYLVESSFSVTVYEHFYAHKSKASVQSYFNNLDDLSKAGVVGYLYDFSDYNNDQRYMREHHNVALVLHESTVPKMVLSGRVDVGVFSNLTYYYLSKTQTLNMAALYRREKPEGITKSHLLLNNAQKTITINQLNLLLSSDDVRKNITVLFEIYGIPTTILEF